MQKDKGYVVWFAVQSNHTARRFACRHLNVLSLNNTGADVKTVSAVLGHAQTSTMLNIYAHSFATAQAAAIEAVANAIELHKSGA